MPGVGSSIPKIDMKATSEKAVALSRESNTAKTITAKPATDARIWNTKNLGLRVASDLISGLSAALVVAPAVAVIDKYIPSPLVRKEV